MLDPLRSSVSPTPAREPDGPKVHRSRSLEEQSLPPAADAASLENAITAARRQVRELIESGPAEPLLQALLSVDPEQAIALLEQRIPSPQEARAHFRALMASLQPWRDALEPIRSSLIDAGLQAFPTVAVVAAAIAADPDAGAELEGALAERPHFRFERFRQALALAISIYPEAVAGLSRSYREDSAVHFDEGSVFFQRPFHPELSLSAARSLLHNSLTLAFNIMDGTAEDGEPPLEYVVEQYLINTAALLYQSARRTEKVQVLGAVVGAARLPDEVLRASSSVAGLLTQLLKSGQRGELLYDDLSPESCELLAKLCLSIPSDQIGEVLAERGLHPKRSVTVEQIIDATFLRSERAGRIISRLAQCGYSFAEKFALSGFSTVGRYSLPWALGPQLVEAVNGWCGEAASWSRDPKELRRSLRRSIKRFVQEAGGASAFHLPGLDVLDLRLCESVPYLLAQQHLKAPDRLSWLTRFPSRIAGPLAVYTLPRRSLTLDDAQEIFGRCTEKEQKRWGSPLSLMALHPEAFVLHGDGARIRSALGAILADTTAKKSHREAAFWVAAALSDQSPAEGAKILSEVDPHALPPQLAVQLAYDGVARIQRRRFEGRVTLNLSRLWSPGHHRPAEVDPLISSEPAIELRSTLCRLAELVDSTMRPIDFYAGGSQEAEAALLQAENLIQSLGDTASDAEYFAVQHAQRYIAGQIPAAEFVDRLLESGLVRDSNRHDGVNLPPTSGVHTILRRLGPRIAEQIGTQVPPREVDGVSFEQRFWVTAGRLFEVSGLTAQPSKADKIVCAANSNPRGNFRFPDAVAQHLKIQRRARSEPEESEQSARSASVLLSSPRFIASDKMEYPSPVVGTVVGDLPGWLRHSAANFYDRCDPYTYSYFPVTDRRLGKLLQTALAQTARASSTQEVRVVLDEDDAAACAELLVGGSVAPGSLLMHGAELEALVTSVSGTRALILNRGSAPVQYEISYRVPGTLTPLQQVSAAEIRRRIPAGLEHLWTPWSKLEEFPQEVRDFVLHHRDTADIIATGREILSLIARHYPYYNGTRDDPHYIAFLRELPYRTAACNEQLRAVHAMAVPGALGRGNCVQTALLIREIAAHCRLPVLVFDGMLLRGSEITMNQRQHLSALSFYVDKSGSLSARPLDRGCAHYLNSVHEPALEATKDRSAVSARAAAVTSQPSDGFLARVRELELDRHSAETVKAVAALLRRTGAIAARIGDTRSAEETIIEAVTVLSAPQFTQILRDNLEHHPEDLDSETNGLLSDLLDIAERESHQLRQMMSNLLGRGFRIDDRPLLRRILSKVSLLMRK